MPGRFHDGVAGLTSRRMAAPGRPQKKASSLAGFPAASSPKEAGWGLSKGRKFQFELERAVFTTVLHRMMDPGSDRACEKWKEGYEGRGAERPELQHFYRAMGWLGEPLAKEEQEEFSSFAPRCIKDQVEERLFGGRRDLFSAANMLFFDTTSIYFEEQGARCQGGKIVADTGLSKASATFAYDSVIKNIEDTLKEGSKRNYRRIWNYFRQQAESPHRKKSENWGCPQNPS